MFVLLVLFVGPATFAQSDGDYQSRQTGAWFTATTWQVYFNGAYRNLEDASAGIYQNQIPTDPPSAGQPIGEIAIQPTHVVTVDNGISLVSNPLWIQSGGTVIVNNTAADPDISVDPSSSVYVEGLFALANAATHAGFDDPSITTFASGGVYEHRYTNTRGIIPLATWEDGSTIRFNSYTAPGNFDGSENLNQDYYNFEWNCPQSGNIILNGNLTTVRNNLSFLATDTGGPSNERLRIFGNTNDNLLSIGGDLVISGLSSVSFTDAGTNNQVDVGGNYTNSATIRTTYVLNAGSLTFNIGGNYTKSGSTIRFTAAAGGTADVYVIGNYSYATSTYSAALTSTANLRFVGNSVQTFSGSGAVTNAVNYFVATGAILDLGTSSLRGAGTFTLGTASTLRAGSTNATGAIVTGTANGNMRVSGTRTYEDGSTIIYNGAGAQFMGNGHPGGATPGVSPVVNTTINNAAGVTTVGSRIISGDLTLQSGNLNAVAGQTLTLHQDIIPGSNFITTTATTIFVVNGDGLTGTFPFQSGAQTVRSLTINRSGGSLKIPVGTNLTIGASGLGTATLTEGDLDFTGTSLTILGSMTVTNGMLFSSSATGTSLTIGGTGAFGTLVLEPGNEFVNSFTYNRSSGTLTHNGNLQVATAFNLTNGAFTNSGSISMSNGSTLTRSAATATITGNSPVAASGTFNIVYSGGPYSTGVELPTSSTDLGNLTISAAGTITLNSDVTVNGSMNLTSNTFAAGTRTITMQGSAWNDNAGSITFTSGSVVFNSTAGPAGTTVGGSSTPQLVNITLNDGAFLTFPAGLVNVSGNIQFGSTSNFNANNGTLVINGATTTTFAGGGRTFRNITLSKTASSDVTLTSGVNLTGVLNITLDGCDFASNGQLTLISTASETASIGQLTAVRTVSGNVNAQRFVQGVGRAYRDISSPVNGGTPAQIISSGITITGTTPITSFPCAGCATNNPSLYQYNESTAGLQTLGYVAVTSSSAAFTVGRGYNLLVRNEVGSPTMSLTGTVNAGSLALPVTYTDSGLPAEDGWNFVGNPYPSAIDWDGAGWTKTSYASNQISVWDPTKNGTGGYRTWNGSAGDLGTGRIAAGQGFWVKATSGATSITVSEASKTTTATSFYRTVSSENLDVVEVVLRETSSNDEDNAFIQLHAMSAEKYDEYDGVKLMSPTFNLASISSDGVPLSINVMDKIPAEPVFLSTSEIGVGEFTIRVNRSGAFGEATVVLHDKFTGKVVDISSEPYTFKVTTSVASQPAGRFYLVFNEKVGPTASRPEILRAYPNPASTTLTVIVNELTAQHEAVLTDLLGHEVGRIELKEESEQLTGSSDVSGLPAGMYLIKVSVGNQLLTKKILKY